MVLQTVRVPTRDDEEVLHYGLSGILPEGDSLALYVPGAFISWLTVDAKGSPRLVTTQHFTQAEINILLPLLECFPYYAPYDMLLAYFQSGRAGDRELMRVRKLLAEAWDDSIRPIRNVASRMQSKLEALNCTTSTIVQTGYVLSKSGLKIKKGFQGES